ncbi:hypothetical protein ACFV1W_23605 [Kitasatospora sp. NPDC059648]|uniref:hypothetical protein n=1 Tax=Kitasatospora sp. NPDC059648 TaxID=3346894 RepID=UPI0036B4AF82
MAADAWRSAKAWKTSKDPDHATGKARVEHLYAIADGEVVSEEGDPNSSSAWTSSART